MAFETTMFRLTTRDIQEFAEPLIARALTNEELLIIASELETFIEWKPIVREFLDK